MISSLVEELRLRLLVAKDQGTQQLEALQRSGPQTKGYEKGDHFNPNALYTNTNGSIRQGIQDAEAALQRIEKGEFGVCLDCHRDITEARLRFSPSVKRCASCQKKHEARKGRNYWR